MRTLSSILTLALLLGLARPHDALATAAGALPTSALLGKPASASDADAGPDKAAGSEDGAITDVDVVLVSGQYSGPGLWKVSKGDHALWILGTVAPVPRGMDWYSPETEAVLAQAQEIIEPPHFISTVGAGGMFKMALALPAILRARRNPDGRTLSDVLPPDLYARWSALKPVYLGSDESIEEWRPVFAAGRLYDAAIERSGLVRGTGVRLHKQIRELEKHRGIKRTSTAVRGEIKHPRKLAKSFARAQIDDVECFRSVLDRLELDVANAGKRANAWAIGDLPALTRLFAHGDVTPCFEAFASTEAARSMGMKDALVRSSGQWLDAAESALAANDTTFATLPVGELLQPDGLLARLQARGYVVVVPE